MENLIKQRNSQACDDTKLEATDCQVALQKENCPWPAGRVANFPEDPNSASTSVVMKTQHTDNDGSTAEVEIFCKEDLVNGCNMERDLPAFSEDGTVGLVSPNNMHYLLHFQ